MRTASWMGAHGWLVAVLVTGCAGPAHRPLEANLVHEYAGVHYHARIEQDAVYRSKWVPGVPQWSPAGAVTPTAIESREPVEPLAHLDWDPRAEFERQLRIAAESSPWLRPGEVCCAERFPEKARSRQHEVPALDLDCVYRLDPSASRLHVETRARLFLGDPGVASYEVELSHASAPVLGEAREAAFLIEETSSPTRQEDARRNERIAAWAANDGAAFRAAMIEGIQATLEMLELDLLARPSRGDPPGPAVYGYGGGWMRHGHALKPHGERCLLRDEDEALFSFPWSLPARGTPLPDVALTCHSPYELAQDCSWFLGVSPQGALGGSPVRMAATAGGDVVLLVGCREVELRRVVDRLEQAGIHVRGARAIADGGGLFLELDGDGYSVLRSGMSP